MHLLKVWDWKYKIFFVAQVHEDVCRFMQLLPQREQEIYSKIIAYYMQFYSFDTLIQLLEEETATSHDYLQKALLHTNKALKIPKILSPYYVAKIQASARLTSTQKKLLLQLLKQIVSDRYTFKNTQDIQAIIFGTYFKELIVEISTIGPTLHHAQHVLQVKDLKTHAASMIDQTLSNKTISQRFGHPYLKEYEISIVNRVGFAEWWDRDLRNHTKDLLVLYTNPDALNVLDFKHTIYHEVYPGHGHYYNFARKHAPTIIAFDHGAMSLLEGWATFCEWNVEDSYYSTILRNRAKNTFHTQWQDTDWCMLIVEDKSLANQMQFKEGFIIFNNFDANENISFRAFLDCCFIDQSINRIWDFLKTLDISKELTKFQQYQIAYYSEQIFKVKNPTMFLTNYYEIKIYQQIYEEWHLTDKIENLLAILNQSVSNYSFLWAYNNAKNQKFSSTLLTLFTVVVAYTSLKDVVVDFLPNYVRTFKFLFVALILFFCIQNRVFNV